MISQMYVLKYLRENQNKMVTQKEIEQYLEVSHPTTVGILKRLESKGFIQTEIVKEGRFSKQVVLTEKSNVLHKNFQMEQNLIFIAQKIQKLRFLLLGML